MKMGDLLSLKVYVHSFLTSCILNVFYYSTFGMILPFCAGVP